jgi:hypothetical protein
MLNKIFFWRKSEKIRKIKIKSNNELQKLLQSYKKIISEKLSECKSKIEFFYEFKSILVCFFFLNLILFLIFIF